MKIYIIEIVFPYTSKDPEVQTPVYFNREKAIKAAKELQDECDPEEEQVRLYECFPDNGVGFFRTQQPVKF